MHDKFIWYFMEKYRQNDYSYKLNKTLKTKIQILKFYNVYITQTSPNLQFSLKLNYTLVFPHKNIYFQEYEEHDQRFYPKFQ